jgi:hemerythrin superfamily protein
VAEGIIDALRQDHDEVRELFARIETAIGDERTTLFQQLVGELIRHEVAEEEILRPVSKRDAGEDIANARLKEESEAEELLKEMESLDPSSAEFDMKLSKLKAEVERHLQGCQDDGSHPPASLDAQFACGEHARWAVRSGDGSCP